MPVGRMGAVGAGSRAPLGPFTSSYITLDGSAGCYASTPDAAALDITGDITVIARIRMTDWTPGAVTEVVSKIASADTAGGYTLYVNTAGTLGFAWCTGAANLFANSTVATGATDGTDLWIAATLDVDNGASGRDLRFFTSAEGNIDPATVTWSQLGTTVTTAGVTTIGNGARDLSYGRRAVTGDRRMTGRIYRAQIRDGVGGSGVPGGTLVSDLDPNRWAGGTSWVAATGETDTLNGTAAVTLVA